MSEPPHRLRSLSTPGFWQEQGFWPVAKFSHARFVRELRSTEPASRRPEVGMRWPEIPFRNQKLGHSTLSRGAHTGREKFATGPLRGRREATGGAKEGDYVLDEENATFCMTHRLIWPVHHIYGICFVKYIVPN